MKKFLMYLVVIAILLGGCATTRLFVKVDVNDKLSIMCLAESEGKTGDITCGFQMFLSGALLDCEVALLELRKGWNPIKQDGKLDTRCSVILDAQELKDAGDTGAEKGEDE